MVKVCLYTHHNEASERMLDHDAARAQTSYSVRLYTEGLAAEHGKGVRRGRIQYSLGSSIRVFKETENGISYINPSCQIRYPS